MGAWDVVKMAYLKRYREAVMRIDERVEEMMRLRQTLEPGAQKLSDMPGGGKRHDWTDTVATLIEMEKDIREECAAFKIIRDSVMAAINSVDDGRYRALLDKRYIGIKTWERIAEEMDVDVTTVYRWHGAALDMVVVNDDTDFLP